MDESMKLSVLVEHLHSLVTALPNLPASVGRQQPEDTAPVRPLLEHTIPQFPAEFSKLPHDGRSHEAVISYLSTHVLPHINRAALSPNYYGLITGGTTPVALLADWLVSLYDQNVSLHLPSETITTTVEVAALNQLLELFNLPLSTWGIGTGGQGGGTFTTGATASNILGLAIGREWIIANAATTRGLTPVSVGEQGLLEATAHAGISEIKILSALPHSSAIKAASVVGLGRSSFISISSDHTPTAIDLTLLEREARVPHRACILLVGAGEINTGHFATSSLTQWHSLRTLCDQLGVWIHVDGAFGLFARLLHDQGPSYSHLAHGVAGIELADSITGDAHKLLNVPYDCGFFFTRHRAVSEAVFLNRAAYLSSTGTGTGGGPPPTVQTPINIGLENSRRFRALPVHATLMAYGRRGHVEMLKRQVGVARRVQRWLVAHKSDYEALPPVGEGDGEEAEEEAVAKVFMSVLFRARDEKVNEELVKKINATKRIYVSGTVWEGRKATRLAVSNWQADVRRDGDVIESVLAEVVGGKGVDA